MKEMKQEHLLFAEVMSTNENERNKFLWKLQGRPSFWQQFTDTCEQYIEGIARSTGFPLPSEKRTERHDAFMVCAAYLFAGLHSLDELDVQKIPDISSELIEEMRYQCDDGAVINARHTLLGAGGGVNEIWAANFLKLLSEQDLNVQGSGLLYGLAMAWISAREQAEGVEERRAALDQEMEQRTAFPAASTEIYFVRFR